MRNTPLPTTESGQAVIELAVGLLALCFVVLGMLYVGGIGLTATKTLLSAKPEAERSAAGATASSDSGHSISRWIYTRVQYRPERGEAVSIPFLANDIAARAAMPEIRSQQLYEDEEPSRSLRGYAGVAQEEQYIFKHLSEMEDLKLPSDLLSDSSFDLAQLHFSRGVLPDQVVNYGGEQIYTITRVRNRTGLKEGVRRAGWFNLENRDIREWESNVVAIPAFGPTRAGISD